MNIPAPALSRERVRKTQDFDSCYSVGGLSGREYVDLWAMIRDPRGETLREPPKRWGTVDYNYKVKGEHRRDEGSRVQRQ